MVQRSKVLDTEGPTPKFLYAIIKQVSLKEIDWNRVAADLEISNGHAARMRFSRFKSQMDGPSERSIKRRMAKKLAKDVNLKQEQVPVLPESEIRVKSEMLDSGMWSIPNIKNEFDSQGPSATSDTLNVTNMSQQSLYSFADAMPAIHHTPNSSPQAFEVPSQSCAGELHLGFPSSHYLSNSTNQMHALEIQMDCSSYPPFSMSQNPALTDIRTQMSEFNNAQSPVLNDIRIHMSECKNAQNPALNEIRTQMSEFNNAQVLRLKSSPHDSWENEPSYQTALELCPVHIKEEQDDLVEIIEISSDATDWAPGMESAAPTDLAVLKV
ncbi:Uncharacterized protein PECH_000191 [Penicillium ucsense]|uniref:Myb-like DNA-binding domain-containing protein n=1 Tax=Penicillium ucsense TaxID=2839758 RepID=A0A8J8WM00_9EURO|nr:Uncharacterized protein PECM_008518 [Penicillium ucsense]KAF7738474.1 Uncharacterized protein PECH_000191 [Penicillium ucsense]